MIEFTKSYKTADGQVFGTVEEAQAHELEALFLTSPVDTPSDLAKSILAKKAEIIDILTTTPNSKPKARRINGGTKKRTPKTVITDAATHATNCGNDLTSAGE